MGIVIRDSPDDSDALSHALARVDAAERALRALERGNAEYAASRPVSFSARTNGADGLIESALLIHIAWQPPKHLADPVRACLAEARAALDNLVWGMSREAGGSPTQLRQCAMPIIAHPNQWPRLRAKMLGALDDEIAGRIYAVQPFGEMRPPLEHPLALLGRASNTDKHRRAVTLGLSPDFRPGGTSLGNFSLESDTASVKSLAQGLDRPGAADELYDVRVGLLADGDALITSRVPVGLTAGTFHYDFESPRIVLCARIDGKIVHGPILGHLNAIVRFVRETVGWVAGDGERPDPWAGVVNAPPPEGGPQA